MWAEMTKPREKASRRMCAGCGQRADAGALVRLVVGPTAPFVAVDLGRKLGGRGVSVHATRRCVHAAARRGSLSKAFRGTTDVTPERLEAMIVAQLEQRVRGLLSAAWRRRRLALGAEAVRAALLSNQGDLLISASDARGRVDELRRAATARGCATATWGTKGSLGDALGRVDLGVLLVIDRGIASAVLDCLTQIEALTEDG
jgi:predicted RNA-binding protein YlxR (DUF448 family)